MTHLLYATVANLIEMTDHTCHEYFSSSTSSMNSNHYGLKCLYVTPYTLLVPANCTDCPKNFPFDHRPPQTHVIITFELRQSNTTPVTGVATVDGSTFIGWVQRGEEKDELERETQMGGVMIHRKIDNKEDFH